MCLLNTVSASVKLDLILSLHTKQLMVQIQHEENSIIILCRRVWGGGVSADRTIGDKVQTDPLMTGDCFHEQIY